MGNRIYAAAVAAFIIVISSANAQVNSVNDFEYVRNITEKTYNYDTRSVEIDGRRVLLESRRNNGLEIGISAGVDYFNETVTPTVGGEFGYHGRNWSLMATCDMGYSQYNKESSRAGQKYLCTNFGAEGGLRLFDLPSRYLHQKEVWLVGRFGYKLRRDEQETETEGFEGSLMSRVEGSSMVAGAGVKVVFKNFMKGNNLYVKAIGYGGHEYYMDRGRSEVRFGGFVTVGLNFNCSKKKINTQAINQLFGSEAAYRAAIR